MEKPEINFEKFSGDSYTTERRQRSLGLTPRVDPRLERFLAVSDRLFGYTKAMGSPLHVLFPQNLLPNIAAFRATLEDLNIKGEMVFTSRVNKSKSVWRTAIQEKCGMDVSTEEGLTQALACGASGNNTFISGPKDASFLTLAIQQNSIINVDCIQELLLISQLWKALGCSNPVRIFVRLSGFKTEFDQTSKDGTFGIHLNEFGDLLGILREHTNTFEFLGISYHIERLSESDRVSVLGQAIEITKELRRLGFNVPAINMGGGFSVCHLQNPDGESKYIDELCATLDDRNDHLPWSDTHLGFRTENGNIMDRSKLISHFVPQAKADHLRAIATAENSKLQEGSAAKALVRENIVLYIEPGGALMDQVGFTATSVNFTKRSNRGYMLVGVEANWSNIQATQPRLFCDPRIIYRDKNRLPCNEGVHFSSNLAISTIDAVHYNLCYPKLLPQRGDLAIFFNTSVYRMDFTESKILLHPLPQKIAVWESKSGEFDWATDDEFRPIGSIYNNYL